MSNIKVKNVVEEIKKKINTKIMDNNYPALLKSNKYENPFLIGYFSVFKSFYVKSNEHYNPFSTENDRKLFEDGIKKAYEDINNVVKTNNELSK